MKISCPACSAKYRIPDERVRGKNRVFRIKCKKCGSEIRVRGIATEQDGGRATMPFNLEMPDTAPATPQRVWFAGIEGKQVGPLTEQEVLDHITGGRLSADDLVWRKGFGAWTPVREVSPFQAKVNDAGAAPAPVSKRSPRRSQTLELSAAMIELLVKLDAQQGAESGESSGDVPDAEPPSLPPLAAETDSTGTSPAAPTAADQNTEDSARPIGGRSSPSALRQPTTATPQTATPQTVTPREEQATATQTISATATARAASSPAATIDAPPPVPTAETPPAVPMPRTPPAAPGVTATLATATAASETEKPVSNPASPSIMVKKSSGRRSKRRGKSSTKVSLPGQSTDGGDASSEAETTITTVPVSKGGRNGKKRVFGATGRATAASGVKTATAAVKPASGGTTAKKSTSASNATAKKTAVITTAKSVSAEAGPGDNANRMPAKKTAGAGAAKGAAKSAAASAKKRSTKDEKKNRGFGWVIGVVVLLAAVGTAVYLMRSQPTKPLKVQTQPNAVARAAVAVPVAELPVAEGAGTPAEPDAGATVDAGAAESAGPTSDVSSGAPDALAAIDAGAPSDSGAADHTAAADRVAADRVAADRVAADRVAADRVAADRVAADRAAADKVAADRVAAAEKTVNGGDTAGKPARSGKGRHNARKTRKSATTTTTNPKRAKPARAKPAAHVPKKQRDEIDVLLEQGRARERQAAAKKAAAAKTAARRPTPVAAPKGDSIDAILRREAAKKAAAAAKRDAANKPAPPPSAGASRSGRKLTTKDVNRIAKAAKNKVMDCYMDHGDVDGGRVTFKVRIYVTAGGSVQNAKVMGKGGTGALGSCISSKVKTLNFPQSSGGTKRYTVRYTVGG